jgi:hypothetical protein
MILGDPVRYLGVILASNVDIANNKIFSRFCLWFYVHVPPNNMMYMYIFITIALFFKDKSFVHRRASKTIFSEVKPASFGSW